MDYQARRRSKELDLGEDEIIVKRSQMTDLMDRLYGLEAAVEDVEQDLEDNPSLKDYKDAVAWIIAAAQPLRGLNLT
ncbi:MAG TPA: hypothetical protein VGJ86_03610 [Acidimicrobiales bacterium]|jgi:hypothetical protein